MTKAKDSRIDRQRRAVVAGAVAVSTQLLSPASVVAVTKRPTSTGSQRLDIERFIAD